MDYGIQRIPHTAYGMLYAINRMLHAECHAIYAVCRKPYAVCVVCQHAPFAGCLMLYTNMEFRGLLLWGRGRQITPKYPPPVPQNSSWGFRTSGPPSQYLKTVPGLKLPRAPSYTTKRTAANCCQRGQAIIYDVYCERRGARGGYVSGLYSPHVIYCYRRGQACTAYGYT
jgi:hypothetical protein